MESTIRAAQKGSSHHDQSAHVVQRSSAAKPIAKARVHTRESLARAGNRSIGLPTAKKHPGCFFAVLKPMKPTVGVTHPRAGTGIPVPDTCIE